jgi:hypothetical protein
MVLFLLNEAVSRDVTSGANRIKTGRRRSYSYSYSYSNAFKPIALEKYKRAFLSLIRAEGLCKVVPCPLLEKRTVTTLVGTK